MRRALRALSTVLIIAGTLLIVDAGVTLAWQEPLSAVYARITQNKLSGDFRKLQGAGLSRQDRHTLEAVGHDAKRRIAVLARSFRRRIKTGQAIGRITIPRIGAKYVVVQGTDTASLRKGPGHYPSTTLPGLPGTVAIAGHRTTYLAPFRHVDRLKRGDTITLEMPYARFTYKVEMVKVVLPTALWVTKNVKHDRLVLSACHPLYSASHRIIVFARQVAAEPRGAAAG
ncbi:MAG TPA: class E sortase [Solirubrobacteraceae bacterium]|jgi:sortase A